MQVIRATAMGMCFGVRDALQTAATTEAPEATTIYGELVHNGEVRRGLDARGFRQIDEDAREAPIATRRVLITAHGIADAERARLRARGHELIDTTCPLVKRAHTAALAFDREGRHVVVLGRHGHVEVRGLVGDLSAATVVASLDDVRTWPHTRLGVVCQTTPAESDAATLFGAIVAANPRAEVAFADTICEPTRQRQSAIVALSAQVDVVVVVGGRGSNNTRQLVRTCEALGRRVVHVETAADLDAAWFAGCDVVGLTAGTSTTDATIDAVERALRAFEVTARPDGGGVAASSRGLPCAP